MSQSCETCRHWYQKYPRCGLCQHKLPPWAWREIRIARPNLILAVEGVECECWEAKKEDGDGQ